MPADFRIEMTPDAQAVIAQLESFPRRMQTALRKALDLQNKLTVSTTDEKRLSEPYVKKKTMDRNTSPNLRRITGTLARSLRLDDENTASEAARIEGDSVVSAIGTNLRYGAVHEFGYQGTVSVPGHQRTLARRRAFLGEFVPLKRGLSGITGATRRKTVSRVVHHDVFVRPHDRDINLPARMYLSQTIESRIPQYSAALSAAIVKSWEDK
jgi:phage gpG-like protein